MYFILINFVSFSPLKERKNTEGKETVIREKNKHVIYLFLTDYLYRVESYHDGTSGSAKSAWMSTRSGQGGKRMNCYSKFSRLIKVLVT